MAPKCFSHHGVSAVGPLRLLVHLDTDSTWAPRVILHHQWGFMVEAGVKKGRITIFHPHIHHVDRWGATTAGPHTEMIRTIPAVALVQGTEDLTGGLPVSGHLVLGHRKAERVQLGLRSIIALP